MLGWLLDLDVLEVFFRHEHVRCIGCGRVFRRVESWELHRRAADSRRDDGVCKPRAA